MKLIHCADLHLDSKMESNLTSEQAATRREELFRSYEHIVEHAAKVGARAILIAGDMFDKAHMKKSVLSRVREQIESHPEIDFLYLKGNHDNVDFAAAGSGEDLPNLKMFTPDGWTCYSYDDVSIYGRELDDDNHRNIATDLVLDAERCNIVMLHGQESGYEGRDRTHTINLTELKGKNIDYLALGHVHSYKKERLDDRGVYCYPGCPEGRGFDECGKKGFVELTIEDGKVESTFIESGLRQLHAPEAFVSPEMNMREVLDSCEKAVAGIEKKDLVKLVLTGTRRMDTDIDDERIRQAFSERFFFFKLNDSTRVSIDYESFAHDKSLKGEFVRLLSEEDLPEDERARIVDLGIKAIMGEEL